ncbi:MAG: hypothetical protein BAJATHORv1_110034 [Candidatus Thorarchaeota archaeon]|nr:MAG: hypothetical protein BAJATHORv1_110034 [Candidatus Thorarchaeota archaeon]
MKIAAVSDIHVAPDGSDKELVKEIHVIASDYEPDVFVIAGDISDDSKILSETLATLRLKNCVNLYVPGNHDIWFEKETGLSSLDKYSTVIGKICQKTGFAYLPDEPEIVSDTAFVGSIGWYDYSFRSEEFDIPEECFESKEFKGSIWYDVFSVDWEFSDREATDLFNRKLQYDLSVLPDAVEKVVYVSHHLPFREMTLYKNILPWDFFSAFMGATSTGQILQEEERVVLAIAGHSHIRKIQKIEQITAMTVPIGYGRPENGEYESLAKSGIALIDLNNGVEILEFVTGDICEGMPYQSTR